MNSYWRKIKTYWKRLPIELRGSIAISIPLACLLGSVIVDTILRQKVVEAQRYFNHTNKVLVTSEAILINLLNAETGLRGYFIGKQKVFLDPYNLALTSLEPNLIKLEQLVQDKPVQLQRAKLLAQIANDKMEHLQEIVQQVETREIVSADVTAESILKGKRTMDRFREVIEQFEAEERRLLDVRTRSLQEQQDFSTVMMWWGIAIAIFGTAIAIQLLRQLAIELRERELRLHESRNLIQAIVANVIDGVMVINSQGRIETFNDAAVKMFGYLSTEVIGWDWEKLFFRSPNLPVKTQPKGQIWQAMGQRKNGDWFAIEVSVNNIALDDDRIAIIRDISDRQQAAAKLAAKAIQLTDLNASLNATNQSLLQSNRELDQFAYIAAHDLKAPLRAISNLSEWIEEDIDHCISVETRSQMHLLRSRVHRMQALLDSLLEYSRSGRGQAPITTVEVDYVLTEIIDSLAPPDTFTIDIIFPMPTLDTRRQSLKQVFTHLIDNAIRHHPTVMGIVEISVIDRGDRYEFTVADNGEGIDPQFQDKIYTIFQTLKARDLQENIGAGLAIVKKIVTAEGGTIHLESAVGKGAIFKFTWLKRPIIRTDTTAIHQ